VPGPSADRSCAVGGAAAAVWSEMAKEHLLSATGRVWNDIKGELDDKSEAEEGEPAESAPVSTDELKKITKWLQHAVTKFSASAAVCDGPKDPALKSMSEELVKAFTAALGTLLSIRRGAGPSLRRELRDVAGGLAKAADSLGSAVGTPGMAVCAGQALDRVKHFERVSGSNRAATRRKILTSLTQLRDASKELKEALQEKGSEAGGDSDDDLDLADSMCGEDELEPEERVVMDAVAVAVAILEGLLKQASAVCMPAQSSGAEPTPLPALEAVAACAGKAQSAVDGLAAHGLGGMDVKAFGVSLGELRAAAAGLEGAPFVRESAEKLKGAVDMVQEALDKVPTD